MVYFMDFIRDDIVDFDVLLGIFYVIEFKLYGIEFYVYKYNEE